MVIQEIIMSCMVQGFDIWTTRLKGFRMSLMNFSLIIRHIFLHSLVLSFTLLFVCLLNLFGCLLLSLFHVIVMLNLFISCISPIWWSQKGRKKNTIFVFAYWYILLLVRVICLCRDLTPINTQSHDYYITQFSSLHWMVASSNRGSLLKLWCIW